MMRIPPLRAGRAWPAALLALAMPGGCHAPDAAAPTYALSAADAAARLQQADLAAFIAAESCGPALDIAAQPADPATVTWDVTRSVFRVASFSVRLDADESGGVRPAILVPADPGGGEIYDGSKPVDNPALRQPLRPAVEELVDAALAGRRFDAAKVRAAQPADGLCGGPHVAGSDGSAPVATSGGGSGGSAPASARPAAAAGADPGAPPISVSTLPTDTSGAAPAGSDQPQYRPEPPAPYNPANDGHEGRPG